MTKSTLTIPVHVSATELSQEIENTINHAIKDVTVKGFRKGKAPKDLAVKHLDPEKMTQRALSTLLPKKLELELVKEKESSKRSRVILIEEPHYHMAEKQSEDGTLEFNVTCKLYPEVNVEAIEKIAIEKVNAKEISQTDIDEFIDRLYKNYQKMNKDQALLNEAPKLETISQDQKFLEIMNVKDQNELIERARQELESNASYNADVETETKLVQEMQNSVEIDIPDVMVNREVERLRGELKQQLQRIGARFEDYLSSTGKNQETLLKEMFEQAVKNITLMLILTELVQKWRIELLPEEITEIKKSGSADHQQTLELMLKQRKALEESKRRYIK